MTFAVVSVSTEKVPIISQERHIAPATHSGVQTYRVASVQDNRRCVDATAAKVVKRMTVVRDKVCIPVIAT